MLSRPACTPNPAATSTASSTAGKSSAARQTIRAWVRHMPRPARLSRGNGRSTRMASRSAMPDAAIVRRPATASTMRAASSPETRW